MKWSYRKLRHLYTILDKKLIYGMKKEVIIQELKEYGIEVTERGLSRKVLQEMYYVLALNLVLDNVDKLRDSKEAKVRQWDEDNYT